MGGLAVPILIGATLLSGATSYMEYSKERKALSLQRRQEMQQRAVASRMERGRTLAGIGGLGVDPASLSITSFLQAQKTSGEETMKYFGMQSRLASRRAFYGKLSNIFGTVGKIGSLSIPSSGSGTSDFFSKKAISPIAQVK